MAELFVYDGEKYAPIGMRLRFVIDSFTSGDGQQDFLPMKTDIKGALLVVVEGVIATGWTVVVGAVRLTEPLPAGKEVQIMEIRGWYD
jgi:hypothetical protein